ncbi:MAG: hypothetical protein ACK557_05375, partial [Planctomycetota bacterium]
PGWGASGIWLAVARQRIVRLLEIGRTDFSPSALLGAPQPGTSNLVAVGLDQMAGDRWCRDQFLVWLGFGRHASGGIAGCLEGTCPEGTCPEGTCRYGNRFLSQQAKAFVSELMNRYTVMALTY